MLLYRLDGESQFIDIVLDGLSLTGRRRLRRLVVILFLHQFLRIVEERFLRHFDRCYLFVEEHFIVMVAVGRT